MLKRFFISTEFLQISWFIYPYLSLHDCSLYVFLLFLSHIFLFRYQTFSPLYIGLVCLILCQLLIWLLLQCELIHLHHLKKLYFHILRRYFSGNYKVIGLSEIRFLMQMMTFYDLTVFFLLKHLYKLFKCYKRRLCVVCFYTNITMYSVEEI
jgi:hypothetical protein